MKTARPLALIFAGMLIGALLSGSVAARQQAPRFKPPVNPRLVYSDGVSNNRITTETPFFIKDTKTDGCWLAMPSNGTISLATAPTEACTFK